MARILIITMVMAAWLLWARYGISGVIHDASISGEIPTIQRVLAEDAGQANAKGAAGRTPLHFAAMGGHGEAVSILVKKGAAVDAKDSRGLTPLHLAAEAGNIDAARALLVAGADVDAKDNDGFTPMWLAILNRDHKTHAEVARLMLEYGADVNSPGLGGATPLHAAVLSKERDLVEILVEDGADMYAEAEVMVGEKGLEHVTPLGLAAYLGDTTALEIFWCQAADFNKKDSEGRAPVHMAAYGSRGTGTIKALEEYGARIDARGRQGRTAVHYAVMGSRPGLEATENTAEAIKALTRGGADLNAPDRNGTTPLMLAELLKKTDLMKALKGMGANVAAGNPEPTTTAKADVSG